MDKTKNDVLSYIKITFGVFIIFLVIISLGNIEVSSSVEQDTRNAIGKSSGVVAGLIIGGSFVINGYKNIRKNRKKINL